MPLKGRPKVVLKKKGPKVKIRGVVVTAKKKAKAKKKKKAEKKAKRKAAKKAVAPVPEFAPSSLIVPPAPNEPKSGCLYCPLFPFHKDFGDFAPHYQRDAQKIIDKEGDPYEINSRNVRERPFKKVKVLFVGEAPGAN